MAANPTTENLRNVAHLGAILGNQEVERKAELKADSVMLGEVTRREEEGMRSLRSSRWQWRWRLGRRRARGRGRASGSSAGRVRGGVASLTVSMA